MQSRPEYFEITNQTLHNFFVNSSDVSVMNVSCHDNPTDWDLANSVAIRFFQWNQAFLLDPFSGKSCSVSRFAILVKDVVRQEMPAVFD